MSVVQAAELNIPHGGNETFDVSATVSELFRAEDARTHALMTSIAGISIATESERQQLEAGNEPTPVWAAKVLARHIG